jgi:uncharacterized protein with NRDE domain
MCTIFCFWRVWPSLPLLVAANRDELYARPASPPTITEANGLRILAGIDARFGGSWMGANSAGLFVGLTNRRGGDARPGSRGAIVMEALACTDVHEAAEAVAAEVARDDPRHVNLLIGSAHALQLLTLRADGLTSQALSPGLHILPSGDADLDDDRWPKVAHARAALTPLLSSPPDLTALWPPLARALADDHTPPPSALPPHLPAARDRAFEAALQALYVRTPIYGTRSSTLAAFDPQGRTLRYAFTEAHPANLSRWQNLEGLLS